MSRWFPTPMTWSTHIEPATAGGTAPHPSGSRDPQLGGERRVIPQDALRPDPPALEAHDRDGEHLGSPSRRGYPRQQPGQLPVMGERHRRLIDQVEAVHGPGHPAQDQIGGQVGEERLGVEPLEGLAAGGPGHARQVPDRWLGRQVRQRRSQVATDDRRVPVLVPHPLQFPHELRDRGGHRSADPGRWSWSAGPMYLRMPGGRAQVDDDHPLRAGGDGRAGAASGRNRDG